MDLTERDLLEIGLDVVAADDHMPGAHLRDRVLATTLAGPRRVDGAWADTARRGLTPLAAFIKTASELMAMLDTLTTEEWSRPTQVEGASVRDLTVHLVGVERYVLGQLGRGPRWPAPGREDHYPMSRVAAADVAAFEGPDVARAWWLAVLDVVAACGDAGPDAPAAYHHLDGTARGLMVIRTFELWTHDEDIRRAIGRELNLLDDARLGLMSGELMEVLALGMALSGTTRPGRTARFEITGSGAGAYDIALAPGDPIGAPDITISVPAVDLCRLAANRQSAAALPVVVEGDRSLLEPVLVGAGAFAAD